MGYSDGQPARQYRNETRKENMRIMRSRRQRVAAFIAATGGALALVGLAANTTGAYFTDVHAGQVDGTFGKVAVSVNGVAVQPGDSTSGPDNMAVHFSNMLPGQDKTVTYTVLNTGSANESIWLAFDNSNGVWAAINQLGTYGDAKISSPMITADYNNLNNSYPQGTVAAGHNACGDPNPAIAYLPAESHVADLAPGQTTSFTFSLGFTSCLSSNALQGGPAFQTPLLTDVIATQQGVSPSDIHNGQSTSTAHAPYTAPSATNI
jgi:hypothetical protein